MVNLESLKNVSVADIYKSGVLAARLSRLDDGSGQKLPWMTS